MRFELNIVLSFEVCKREIKCNSLKVSEVCKYFKGSINTWPAIGKVPLLGRLQCRLRGGNPRQAQLSLTEHSQVSQSAQAEREVTNCSHESIVLLSETVIQFQIMIVQ